MRTPHAARKASAMTRLLPLPTRRLSACAGLAVACVGVALVVAPTSPALAFDVTQAKVVTANPADWTPDVTSSGSVRYFAQAGSIMVAVGNFTQVKNHGSATTLSRHNAFSFNATTGLVDTAFAPNLDGLAYVAVISADGKNVYIGGEFKHVNGISAVGLAEVNLPTGACVSPFKPGPAPRVETMKLVGGKLYIGGGFSHVGGKAIGRLARVDPITGAPDAAFTATFAGTNNAANPGPTLLVKMDISPDAQRL